MMLLCRGVHSLLVIFLAFCYPIAAYINPIIPGFNPDPSTVRVGDDYGLVVSSLEFTPGIAIYHSKDLINWTLHNHALTRLRQLAMFGTPSSLGVWASTIRYHNNRYHKQSIPQTIDTTSRPVSETQHIDVSAHPVDRGEQGKFGTFNDGVGGNVFPKRFYVWTDDIESSNRSDPVYSDRPGFEADLFWDDDGKVYLGNTKQQFTSDLVRCWTGEIDLDTGRSLTKPQPLVNVTVLWPQGGHVYKINGTYYLMTAAGGTNSDSH
ncbi:glycoside hydrolase [Aspergillus foveolatus]|uniref:glycoside hydrolase n=1 Tax=Aspergillus foveolatus TaxID=210207 RepID=UPI003CCD5D5C